MKALVFGAGVIGCYLTHVLCEAGRDVTLLARGAWKDALETHGLELRHLQIFCGGKTGGCFLEDRVINVLKETGHASDERVRFSLSIGRFPSINCRRKYLHMRE
ncbi:MAG: hypothetical protein IKN04_14320 [Clostridia bacterium]|nr:hypothetical protein [Clostridia bacterium]